MRNNPRPPVIQTLTTKKSRNKKHSQYENKSYLKSSHENEIAFEKQGRFIVIPNFPGNTQIFVKAEITNECAIANFFEKQKRKLP